MSEPTYLEVIQIEDTSDERQGLCSERSKGIHLSPLTIEGNFALGELILQFSEKFGLVKNLRCIRDVLFYDLILFDYFGTCTAHYIKEQENCWFKGIVTEFEMSQFE
ncbi:hypothetical protein DUI87_16615 [Hirundo rustica rustica]|uniref:Uncharacterized protein n=1 Tax=Hirundo rustica rustica TaxID=333673 RepID=A0A3M0K1H8_HIRRU|nr:hypothetical protein DUI87_16615 [Hirundo rustica rustica]